MAKTPCIKNCEKYTNAITTGFMIDILSGKVTDEGFFELIETLSRNIDEGRNKIRIGAESISDISSKIGGGQYLDNSRMLEGVIMAYATNDPIYLQQFVNIAKKNATQGTRGKYLADMTDMQGMVSTIAKNLSKFDVHTTITQQVLKNQRFNQLFEGVNIQNIAKGLKSLMVFNYTTIKELNRYGSTLVDGFDAYISNKDQYSPEFYKDIGSNFDLLVKKELDKATKGNYLKLSAEEKAEAFFDAYNKTLKDVLGSSIDDPFLKSVLETKFADGKDVLPSFNVMQNYALFRSINSGIPQADAMARLMDSLGDISGDISGAAKKSDISIESIPELQKTQKYFDNISSTIKSKFGADIILDAGEFSKGAGEGGRKYMTEGGVIYGFTKGGKIYINPDFMSSQTLVHEATHLRYDIAKIQNKSLVGKRDSLVKKGIAENDDVLSLYNRIKEAYPENSEQELFEEMLTTMTEGSFVKMISTKDESFGDMIKEFLKELYSSFLSLFKGKSLLDFSEIAIENLSIDDFVKLVAREVLDSGTSLTTAESIGSIAGRALTQINNASLFGGLPSLTKFSLSLDVSPKGKKLGFVNRWDEAIFEKNETLKKLSNGNKEKFSELLKADTELLASEIKQGKYTIDTIPQSYIDVERGLAAERGQNVGDVGQAQIDMLKDQHQVSLDSWVNYLDGNTDYSDGFKNYALREISGKAIVGGKIKKRTRDTVAGYLAVNANAVADFFNNGIKSFFEEYPIMLNRSISSNLQFQNAIKKGDTDGRWIRFEKGGDGADLSSLCAGTPRCTAQQSTAKGQLDQGDFFVFTTKGADGEYNIPRIAIRTDGTGVAEVRGIADNKQNLEGDMTEIAREKYATMQGGDKYEKKDSDMKMVTIISAKSKNGEELSIDELRFLYEIDGQINGFGYDKDPRIEQTKGGRDNLADYTKMYGVDRSEVTDIFDENVVNFKLYVGKANFRDTKIVSLGKLEVITGDAVFVDTPITSLGNLESIGGSANFRDSQVTSLGNLKSIRGNANFRDSQLTSLGNLKSIGGDANIRYSQITSLGNLESIGGYAYFRDSQVTSLGNLKSIGGYAVFVDTPITSLGNLKSIGGEANFNGSQITSLGNLKSIGRNAYFKDTPITSLGNLKSIGGDADFRDSQVTSLGNLESIGGDANFRDSQVTSLGNLKSIGGNADFKDSQVTDLGKLESIGGKISLENSKVDNRENLKAIGSIDESSLDTEKYASLISLVDGRGTEGSRFSKNLNPANKANPKEISPLSEPNLLSAVRKGIDDSLPVSDIRSTIFNDIAGFQALSKTDQIDVMTRYKEYIQNDILKNTGDLKLLSSREKDVVGVLSKLTADFSAGGDISASLSDVLYKQKIKKYDLVDLDKENDSLKTDILDQLLGKTDVDLFPEFSGSPTQKQLMMLDIVGVDSNTLDDLTGVVDIAQYIANVKGLNPGIVGAVEGVIADFLQVSDTIKRAAVNPDGFSIRVLNDLSNKKELLANKVQQTIDFLQSYQPNGGKNYPQRKILQAFFDSPVTTDKMVLVDTNPLAGLGDSVSIAKKKLYVLSQRYELNLPIEDIETVEYEGNTNKFAKKLFNMREKSLGSEPISFLVKQRKQNDPVMEKFFELKQQYLSNNPTENPGSVVFPEFGLSLDYEKGLLKVKSANKFDIDNRVGQLEYVRNILTDSESVIGVADNTNELDTAMNSYLNGLFGDMDIENFDKIKTTIMGKDSTDFVDVDALMKRVNTANQRYQQGIFSAEKEFLKIKNMEDSSVIAIISKFISLIKSDLGISIKSSDIDLSDMGKLKEYIYFVIYGGVENSYSAKLGLLESIKLITPAQVESYKMTGDGKRDDLIYKLDKAIPELRVPYDYNNQYKDTLGYVVDNYESLQPQLSNFGEQAIYNDLPKNVQAFVQTAFPKNYLIEGLDITTSNDQKARLVLSKISAGYAGIRNQKISFTDQPKVIPQVDNSSIDLLYKGILTNESVEKRNAISHASDIIFDNVDGIKNEKVTGVSLNGIISEIKSELDQYKQLVKEPLSFDDIEFNKQQQNTLKSKIYNLQTTLASEYGGLFKQQQIKNIFFYYEQTIPFVPDTNTYNAIDGYISNIKDSFSSLQKEIETKIQKHNKEPKTYDQEYVLGKMLNTGYITISKDGILYNIDRKTAINSAINKIIEGLSYVKVGDSAYIDNLIDVYRKNDDLIDSLSETESKNLYSMLSVVEFAAKVNDPLFTDITKNIENQASGMLKTFFNEYKVEGGLPRIMNTPLLTGENALKEILIKRDIFDYVRKSLRNKTLMFSSGKATTYSKGALVSFVSDAMKRGGISTSSEDGVVLSKSLVEQFSLYPLLQRSSGVELLYNDKNLSRSNEIGKRLQKDKNYAFAVRKSIIDNPDKDQLSAFLRNVDIGNENYNINLGEFFDGMDMGQLESNLSLSKISEQISNPYASFDFIGRYIDGTPEKANISEKGRYAEVVEGMSNKFLESQKKAILDLTCIL